MDTFKFKKLVRSKLFKWVAVWSAIWLLVLYLVLEYTSLDYLILLLLFYAVYSLIAIPIGMHLGDNPKKARKFSILVPFVFLVLVGASAAEFYYYTEWAGSPDILRRMIMSFPRALFAGTIPAAPFALLAYVFGESSRVLLSKKRKSGEPDQKSAIYNFLVYIFMMPSALLFPGAYAGLQLVPGVEDRAQFLSLYVTALFIQSLSYRVARGKLAVSFEKNKSQIIRGFIIVSIVIISLVFF